MCKRRFLDIDILGPTCQHSLGQEHSGEYHRHDMPPPLSSLCGRRSALRRPADGNVAAVSRGQHVPTPTAVAAWRAKHGGEQSGLVTLTFDLLTLKVVSESRVTYATYVLILVFLRIRTRLRPDVCVRQTSDRRQTASSLYAPACYGRGIICGCPL